jgi:hypothetical protein
MKPGVFTSAKEWIKPTVVVMVCFLCALAVYALLAEMIR